MTPPSRIDNMRVIRSPRGTELSAKSWLTEAPLRMLMNNLDPDVDELAWSLSDVGIEIVHEHAQRRFGEPAPGAEICPVRRADHAHVVETGRQGHALDLSCNTTSRHCEP